MTIRTQCDFDHVRQSRGAISKRAVQPLLILVFSDSDHANFQYLELSLKKEVLLGEGAACDVPRDGRGWGLVSRLLTAKRRAKRGLDADRASATLLLLL